MPLQNTEEEEKDFGNFFNEAVANENGEPAVEPTPISDPEPVVTPVVDDPVVDPDAAVEDPVVEPVVPAVDPTPVEEDWKIKYETVKSELDTATHKMSSWEGRIRKANDRAAKAEERLAALEAKATPATATDPEPSTDDDKILQEFKEEFPELVKPLEVMARKFAKGAADQSLEKVTPTIEEIQKEQKQTATDLFFAPIYEAHPDWKQVYDNGDLQVWIDTQPALQARVYSEVVGNGSQKEIIGMFDAYKKDKKIPVKPTPPAGVDPNVQNIVAVPAKGAGIPAQAPSKDDYETGWKDALSTG